MNTQLSFHSTQFNIVNHNQQQWLTAPQIAAALDYADQSSVNRIYARHMGEFTSCMTASVKLTDPKGDAQDTRIFSLRGAHLIAMFARTPVAKEFRRWVLDVLDREVGTTAIQPVPQTEETITLTLTRSELCSLCWGWSAGEYMREELEKVSPGLIALRSPLIDSIGTMASSYKRTLEAVRVVLVRETRCIEPHPYSNEDANWRTELPRMHREKTL